MPAVRRAPKQEQTDQNKKVWRAVKDAVPSRVEFQVLDGVDGVPTAEHVMPLQHLMQHDAIEETAQSEAEENARRNRKMAASGNGGYGHRTDRHPKSRPCILDLLCLSICAFSDLFAHPSHDLPDPATPIISSLAIRHVPRIPYTPGTGPTCCHHALLVGDEAAIRAAAIVAVVLGAPWTVHLSGAGRRKESAAHQGRYEQQTISHRSHLNLPSFLNSTSLQLSRSGPAANRRKMKPRADLRDPRGAILPVPIVVARDPRAPQLVLGDVRAVAAQICVEVSLLQGSCALLSPSRESHRRT